MGNVKTVRGGQALKRGESYNEHESDSYKLEDEDIYMIPNNDNSQIDMDSIRIVQPHTPHISIEV